MNNKLNDWFYKMKLSRLVRPRTLLLIVAVVVLFAVVAGGSGYYVYQKRQEAEALRKQKLAAVQAKRNNIHQFYETLLAGADIEGFLTLYQEITHSRYPIELTGYQETLFNCNTSTCNFSYKPKTDGVFNVQKKQFRGEKYEASFSQDTIDYQDVPSGMGENPLLLQFRQREKIDEPDCNDMLNYLYSYNSLAPKTQHFILDALPASSVLVDEAALPGNPENYGLLKADWSVTLEDNYFVVSSFWRSHPYASAFIIKSAEKINNTLNIRGTFLCKK